jgi:DNA helicase II / ATP-dependent DNA helicase PcrA
LSGISNQQEFQNFFLNLAKTWQHHIDYNFFKDIELSPEQIKIIDHDDEQMLINGYAGTGKSITLLYKFINTLVRENERKRILYISYNKTLIDDTKKKLNESQQYLEHKLNHDVEIVTYHEMAYNLLKNLNVVQDLRFARLTQKEIMKKDEDALVRVGAVLYKYTNSGSEEYKNLSTDERLYSTHTSQFVREEIRWMKENGFINKDEYLEVERKGRSNSIRLTKKQRSTIFKMFEEYNKALKEKYHGAMDLEDYALEILNQHRWINDSLKYDYIYIDEVQDLQPMQIKTLVLLTKKSIVISGDPRQTIHRRSPYSYEKLGLSINEKGRNKVLNKNYRCTASIMQLANSLNFDNGEHKIDKRTFVNEGDNPKIVYCENPTKEIEFVVKQIQSIFKENPKQTVAIINREDDIMINKGSSKREIMLKRHFANVYNISNYDKKFEKNSQKQIFYTNAYDVKGLEFDHVFIIQFSRNHYPLKSKIDELRKNTELEENMLKNDIEEIENIEKKLLYVGMTRARKSLFITYSGKDKKNSISRFARDFEPKSYELI